MNKVAVIWNPALGCDCPDEVIQKLCQYPDVIALIGDAPGLDHEIRRAVPSVVIRPCHMTDDSIPFSARNFYAANREKIRNADAVIVVLYEEGCTDWAVSYSQKLKKEVITCGT